MRRRRIGYIIGVLVLQVVLLTPSDVSTTPSDDFAPGCLTDVLVDTTERHADSTIASEGAAVEDEVHRTIRIGLVGGLNRRITPGYEPPEELDYTTGGLTGILRLTLVPEHLLRLGVETGYMKLTAANRVPSANDVPDRLVLTAIPVLATVAMGGDALEVGGGVGFYSLVVSAGTTNRTEFASGGTELGYMGFISWHPELFGGRIVGLDLHAYHFVDRPITVIAIGLGFHFSLFEL